MKKTKTGFTLLEVILVVAIATLLFMSVVIGIGSRIATSRYETASSEIADFLRDVYTSALNTENARSDIQGARQYCTIYGATDLSDDVVNPEIGKQLFKNSDKLTSGEIAVEDVTHGRTDCAIYGKAMYFGAKDGKIHIFDVVGDAVDNVLKKMKVGGKEVETTELKQLEGKTTLQQLEYVHADIFAAVPDVGSDLNENIRGSNANCRISPAGAKTTYEPNWGALFKTANNFGGSDRINKENFVGMAMIVREPASGNVQTFFYESADSSEDWSGFLATGSNWEDVFDLAGESSLGSCGVFDKNDPAYTEFTERYSPVFLMKEQEKKKEDEDENDIPENTGFCVGSDDFYVAISNVRKYIQFYPGGQNASAIKLIESDDKEENPCRG